MTRVFSIQGTDLAIAGADTIAYLRPSATVSIEILEVRIGFHENATSAQQPVQLVRQVVSGSPASTAVTPLPYDAGLTQTPSITGGTGDMSAGTAGVAGTTESGGATSVIVTDAFNVLTGYIWVPPTADARIIMPANSGSIFGVVFPVAPGTTTGGYTVTVTFAEGR